ncbi:3D domain-containing protein [Paenibacillus sp. sgz302251]|uniref:3D domain-containing protein n=1 Tax=Paenibacillus sp. sgz302251 TaxID=3414493 RepID=UPI003C7ADD2F
MIRKSTLAAAVIGLSVMLAAGTASAASKTHTASDNDTFWKLSKQYNVNLNTLLQANPTIDPLNVYKGLKLTIPVSESEAAAKPSNTMQAFSSKSEPMVKAIDGKEYAYSKAMDVKATAYTAAASENSGWAGLDYFGNKLAVGTIAVDPNMIPLNSKVYVTGYDYRGLPVGGMVATATDIGGSIKGNRIDLFVPGTTSQAMSFGIQNVKVYVLE